VKKKSLFWGIFGMLTTLGLITGDLEKITVNLKSLFHGTNPPTVAKSGTGNLGDYTVNGSHNNNQVGNNISYQETTQPKDKK
jgi:hypothetical protein